MSQQEDLLNSAIMGNYWPEFYENWWTGIAWAKEEHIKFYTGAKSQAGFIIYYNIIYRSYFPLLQNEYDSVASWTLLSGQAIYHE